MALIFTTGGMMHKFLIGCTLLSLLLCTKVFAYTEVANTHAVPQRDTYQITVLNFTEQKFFNYTDYHAKVIGPVPEMIIRVSHFSPTKFEAGKSYNVERAATNWLIVGEVK